MPALARQRLCEHSGQLQYFTPPLFLAAWNAKRHIDWTPSNYRSENRNDTYRPPPWFEVGSCTNDGYSNHHAYDTICFSCVTLHISLPLCFDLPLLTSTFTWLEWGSFCPISVRKINQIKSVRTKCMLDSLEICFCYFSGCHVYDIYPVPYTPVLFTLSPLFAINNLKNIHLVGNSIDTLSI